MEQFGMYNFQIRWCTSAEVLPKRILSRSNGQRSTCCWCLK